MRLRYAAAPNRTRAPWLHFTAVFLSILIFGSDIRARISEVYLSANAPIVRMVAALVDADIKRMTDEVAAESARNTALTAQATALRQNSVDPSVSDPQMRRSQVDLTRATEEKERAEETLRTADTFASNELAGVRGAPDNSGRPGRGPQRRAAEEKLASAKARVTSATAAVDAARGRIDTLIAARATSNEATRSRSKEELPAFEEALSAENTKLANLRSDLAKLVRGRGDAIRQGVDSAPDHVPMDNGLLAQISTVGKMADADPKVFGIALLIDVVSFGLELAAVLAKVTSYVLTTYAALLVRDHYMRVLRIVDDLAGELEQRSTNPAATAAAPGTEDRSERRPSNTGPANDDNPLSGMRTFDDDPFGPSTADQEPQKRPRGRPRKTTLN